MAYLSNGKGDKSTIIEKETMVNSVRTVQLTQFTSFGVLMARMRSEHKQDKCKVVSKISNNYLNSLI
jgi:hypothetical protein